MGPFLSPMPQRWERKVRREQRRWTQEQGDRNWGEGSRWRTLEEGNGKEGGVEGVAGSPESGRRLLWVGVGQSEGENQEGTWGGEALL